jgi:hypothetical protein
MYYINTKLENKLAMGNTMVVCKQCHKRCLAEGGYCDNCGFKKAEVYKKVKCTGCENILDERSSYCCKCGSQKTVNGEAVSGVW